MQPSSRSLHVVVLVVPELCVENRLDPEFGQAILDASVELQRPLRLCDQLLIQPVDDQWYRGSRQHVRLHQLEAAVRLDEHSTSTPVGSHDQQQVNQAQPWHWHWVQGRRPRIRQQLLLSVGQFAFCLLRRLVDLDRTASKLDSQSEFQRVQDSHTKHDSSLAPTLIAPTHSKWYQFPSNVEPAYHTSRS